MRTDRSLRLARVRATLLGSVAANVDRRVHRQACGLAPAAGPRLRRPLHITPALVWGLFDYRQKAIHKASPTVRDFVRVSFHIGIRFSPPLGRGQAAQA